MGRESCWAFVQHGIGVTEPDRQVLRMHRWRNASIQAGAVPSCWRRPVHDQRHRHAAVWCSNRGEREAKTGCLPGGQPLQILCADFKRWARQCRPAGCDGANGPGDPYALYGNCTSRGGGEGQTGFRAKADILTDVGISLDTVRTIDIISCANPSSSSSVPPLAIVSCSNLGFGPQANYYNQCVWGLDARRNNVAVAINK